ncbi:MAG: hypothetical protein ACLQDV_30205 [Candidatus Binataceae bacterium]
MKRTLTILTAAGFAAAIALPAFAQTGGSPEASPAAAASPSSEKPAKKHHHGHKSKKAESGMSETAPSAAPSDSTTK